MIIAFKQNETRLLYLGFGVPLWLYLIIVNSKFLNKIIVEKDYVTVKNAVFGKKRIQYAEIEYWKETPRLPGRILSRTLILKTHKKITILEDVDCKGFEILWQRLKSDWKSKEKI